MKKVFFKTMMGAGLVGVLSAGCVESPTDLYDPNYVIEQYKAKWEEQFGEVDPDHTWNMAKKVVADINLYGIADDECEVKVYTANPINSTSSLLAKGSVQGNKVVSFDVPSPLQYVFVTATNSRGALVNGYYKIVDGVITVGESVTRAETCPVTVGEKVAMGDYSYNDAYNNYEYKSVPEAEFGDFYNLNGVVTKVGNTWELRDFMPITGIGGVFEELKNNREKWEGLLSYGVVYTTKTSGPISLSYIFGATDCNDMLGYFYYTDESEIATAPRYILMDDARPSSKLKVVAADGTDKTSEIANNGDLLGTWVSQACNADLSPDWAWAAPLKDYKITGTNYQLVYFGNGVPTYEFPANIHIAFFIINKNLNGDNLSYKTYYSIPSMNESLGKYFWRSNGALAGGEVSAVTYNYNGQTFLGFEDLTDKDMNDILFMINGDFTEEPEELNPDYVEPTAKEWIFACEDLGGVGDFDFNDIVFKVAYASGETTATVTPLAAGGTLEANIMFGSQSLGEIHELLGGSVGTMINTGLGATGEASSVEVQVGEDYSISNNFGGFSLQIVKEDGTTTVDITAPGQGEAPQMICVGAPWAWPKETVSIVKAYPDFGEWGANYANDGWTSNKVAGNVCE